MLLSNVRRKSRVMEKYIFVSLIVCIFMIISQHDAFTQDWIHNPTNCHSYSRCYPRLNHYRYRLILALSKLAKGAPEKTAWVFPFQRLSVIIGMTTINRRSSVL